MDLGTWDRRTTLDFSYDRFPAGSDHLAWLNFEFIASDRSIHAIDLVITIPWGVFLVEIGSRSGRFTGGNAAWTKGCGLEAIECGHIVERM